MRIYSKYEDVFEGKKRGEVMNPNTPCYVDDIGFISMESQIKSLINAGINLENYRRGEYDYQYDDNQDIDEAVVSVENEQDFMPSVDLPEVINEFNSQIVAKATTETSSNTSSERREGTSEPLSNENGESIPPSQTNAL